MSENEKGQPRLEKGQPPLKKRAASKKDEVVASPPRRRRVAAPKASPRHPRVTSRRGVRVGAASTSRDVRCPGLMPRPVGLMPRPPAFRLVFGHMPRPDRRLVIFLISKNSKIPLLSYFYRCRSSSLQVVVVYLQLEVAVNQIVNSRPDCDRGRGHLKYLARCKSRSP